MSLERKRHFVEELKKQLQSAIADARQAEVDAAAETEAVRSEARNKDDVKSAIDSGRMAVAHGERRERAKQDIDRLIAFAARELKALPPTAKIGLGAMVDVRIESDEGSEERTLFVLPVGAGSELEGPGGDGFLSVITPASPVGQALQGAVAGDCFDLRIAGVEREWTVVDVC